MELEKKIVLVGQGRCRGNIQITLDDDFNVPDRKPDIRQIVASQGEVHTAEITPGTGSGAGGDKVHLEGSLKFGIFYISEDENGHMQGMEGEIPFQEWVNLTEPLQGQVLVRWILEDLSVEIINSRKISVRAIVVAQVRGEGGMTEEIAADILSQEEIPCRKTSLSLTTERLLKKDTLRVKDEYTLPSVKPDIEEIVYQEAALRGTEVRLDEEKISITGEVRLLIFYYGMEADKLQYLELELPFSDNLNCAGCSSDMIPDVEVSILKRDIQVKSDEDGEERILDVEIILELSIRTYGVETMEILDDFYAIDYHLEPVRREIEIQELAGHFGNKLRLSGQIAVPESSPAVLQICGTSGTVKIDEYYQTQEGIRVEGIVELPVIYITAEDTSPIYSVRGMLPFAETIFVDGLPEQASFEVKPCIDQVVLSLSDGRYVEAKATLNLDAYVFRKTTMQVVTGYERSEIKPEELQTAAGLVGCFVQEGDSWWSVGRKYRVPVERLKNMNEELSGELAPGMRLLVSRVSVV